MKYTRKAAKAAVKYIEDNLEALVLESCRNENRPAHEVITDELDAKVLRELNDEIDHTRRCYTFNGTHPEKK